MSVEIFDQKAGTIIHSTSTSLPNGPEIRTKIPRIHSQGSYVCIPSYAGDGAGAGPLQGLDAGALVRMSRIALTEKLLKCCV